MLCTIGDLVEDVVVHLDGPPRRGTDRRARIVRRRGGSAANVAAFAVAAGAPARFIGRVGDDSVGDVLIADLVAAGVDARVQRGGRTATVVVLVEPGGERTMLPDRAAATDLAAVDAAWLRGVTWLHVPAYSLIAEPIASTTIELIGRSRPVPLSVDVASVGSVTAFGRERFGALLDELDPDVVFANDEESALVVPGRHRLLVAKHGPAPVVVTRRGSRPFEVPVDPVDRVVDSTGAGDAFAAGFIVATIAGTRPDGATRAGSALAAGTLGQPGAGLGVLVDAEPSP